MIVISDGFWNAGTHPEVISLTTTLKDTIKLKLFRICCRWLKYRYTQLEQGWTNTPLFADNETELLATNRCYKTSYIWKTLYYTSSNV